jgi:hypothetical protein
MAAPPESRRWGGNWRAVSEKGSVRIDVARGRGGTKSAVADTRLLPAGTEIVLVVPAPGSVRRARSVAAAAGVGISREYLALPSAHAPAYLIENAAGPFRVFVDNVLGSPSQGALGRLQDVAVGVIRRMRPRRLVGMLGAGSVVVGRRT